MEWEDRKLKTEIEEDVWSECGGTVTPHDFSAAGKRMGGGGL